MNCVLFFATLFCAIGVSTSFLGPRTTSGQKRDCRWMHWAAAGRCEKAGSSTFRRMRQRVNVPARNGGKKCVGPSITHLPCTETQYRVGTFLKTVNSVGEDEAHSHGVAGMAPEPSLCWDYMTGKAYDCRKRRAVGSIESYVDEVKARTKRQALNFKHRDVLFVLDESGSVGEENFKKELRMTKAIVNSWCGAIAIGKQQTKVGILSFDRGQRGHLNFKDLSDSVKVSNHIDNNIKYTVQSSEETCLYDALEYARTSMFHMDRGARTTDPGVEKLVFLFTDGCPNCGKGTMLKELASTFEKEKISIIAFVIGNIDSCRATMKTMLEGTRCKEVFEVKDWEEFDKTIEEIEQIDLNRCTDKWPVVGMDCPYA